MKKLILLTLTTGLMCSCGFVGGRGGSGELDRGTKGRGIGYSETPPNGMAFIPSGSFLLGQNDQDINSAMTAGNRVISLDAFWMDQTEITNYEYRQFTNYVRDSVARRLLSDQFPEFVVENEEYADDPNALPALNWNTRIDRRSADQREVLNTMYYSPEESIFGRREVDMRHLIYEYAWFDFGQATKARYDYEQKKYVGTVTNAEGESEEITNRSSFIIRNFAYVYPDTLCWIRDFEYAYNEPFTTRYFWHTAYNDYPVVGVTWSQVNAFCHWRSAMLENSYNRNRSAHHYRLPNELEWEYAARGGLQGELYPWGGPYTTNKEGCYLANFKPQRGKYGLDGGVRTVPVGSYDPNDFGLYDMAGNVAEWTVNAFDEGAYSFYHDMTPNYTYNAKPSDPLVRKRKVVRGGSWKDIAYFMQNGVRTYEYQDSARSYIGFRCVRTYMGSR